MDQRAAGFTKQQAVPKAQGMQLREPQTEPVRGNSHGCYLPFLEMKSDNDDDCTTGCIVSNKKFEIMIRDKGRSELKNMTGKVRICLTERAATGSRAR